MIQIRNIANGCRLSADSKRILLISEYQIEKVVQSLLPIPKISPTLLLIRVIRNLDKTLVPHIPDREICEIRVIRDSDKEHSKWLSAISRQ